MQSNQNVVVQCYKLWNFSLNLTYCRFFSVFYVCSWICRTQSWQWWWHSPRCTGGSGSPSLSIQWNGSRRQESFQNLSWPQDWQRTLSSCSHAPMLTQKVQIKSTTNYECNLVRKIIVGQRQASPNQEEANKAWNVLHLSVFWSFSFVKTLWNFIKETEDPQHKK